MKQGRGLLEQEWYSICSRHQEFDEHCAMCQTGSWEFVWKVRLSGALFRLSPRVWRWLANHR